MFCAEWGAVLSCQLALLCKAAPAVHSQSGGCSCTGCCVFVGPLHSGGVPRWLLFFLEGHRPPPVTLTLGLGLRCAALGQSSVCVACALFTASSLHLLVFVTLQCLVHTAGIGLCTHVTPLYVGGPPRAPTLRASVGLFLEVGLLSFGSTHTVSHPRPDSVMSLQAASLNPVTPTAHEPQQHTMMSFWSEDRKS